MRQSHLPELPRPQPLSARRHQQHRLVSSVTAADVGLRRSAACAHLSRDQVSELVANCAELVEERKRIRRSLDRLPESFADVRKILNDLARAVR